VDGCLAESPAEEAGIQPGDRIIEIGALFHCNCVLNLDSCSACAGANSAHSIPGRKCVITVASLLHEIFAPADGYPTGSLKRSEMVALLRGPSSSAITLTISRQGFSHSRAVYMERRPLPQPPIKEV
jgi:C-terminal processing protease CtpA/Prc